MNARRALRVAPAAVFVLALGACGSGSHPQATPVTVFDVARDPGASVRIVNTRRPVRMTRAEVRDTFDALLSRHAQLVAEVMHEVGSGNGHPDTAIAALAANTQSLTNAIALIYGSDGARAFAQLWEQHTQFFIDYAQADLDHDAGARAEAVARLTDYQKDFGSFVSTATGGRVPLLAVTRLLHGHVEDMTGYIDADTAGHAAEASRLLGQAVAHMHMIATAVSDAIAAQHLATVGP